MHCDRMFDMEASTRACAVAVTSKDGMFVACRQTEVYVQRITSMA